MNRLSAPKAPIQPSYIAEYNFTKLPFVNAKKNLDFHSIFKTIPSTERLIKSFRCAIAKPTLLEGKLYVSEHHISFKVNWPSKRIYSYKFIDIIDIRKGSFANLLHNAIIVELGSETIFFGSINQGRDEKLDLLQNIYELHVAKYSFYRKFPVLDGVSCSCGRVNEGNCGFCLKIKEINKNDPDRRLRLPGCPSNFVNIAKTVSNSDNSTAAISEFEYHKIRNSSCSSLNNQISDNSKLDEIVEDSQESQCTFGETVCECYSDNQYELLAEITFPCSLQTLWKEWFMWNSEGNIFTKFLDQEKIQDLKVSKWSSSNVFPELVPLNEAIDSGFSKLLDSIKVGDTRNTTRKVQLNHGIPFVPKTIVSESKYLVTHKDSEKSLGILNQTKISLMGIETNLKKCFLQTGENETRVKIFLNVVLTGKGKIAVPKALAEKSTVEGIKKFYSDLEPYFHANLKEKYNPEMACTCKDLVADEGYQEIYNEIVPTSIENLWEQIYCIIPGNIIEKHIANEKWADLMYGPWRAKEDLNDTVINADKCFGLKFRPPFEKLENLYHQRIFYTVQNVNPIFPSSMAIKTHNLITKKSTGSLCIHTNSLQQEIGVVSDIKTCLKTTNQGVHVRVVGLISFVKGRVAIDKPLLEPNLYINMKFYYQSLFGHFLQKHEIITENSWLCQLEDFKERLKKNPEIILTLMFVFMLCFYSIVLWNLLGATQRLQAEIGELKLELIQRT